MRVAGSAAVLLLAVGGLSWCLVGLAGVDPLGWLFGPDSIVTRGIRVALGIAALYCLYKLPSWSRAG
jgi:uncharacterized membrane protein YuzA (DUF378 family)